MRAATPDGAQSNSEYKATVADNPQTAPRATTSCAHNPQSASLCPPQTALHSANPAFRPPQPDVDAYLHHPVSLLRPESPTAREIRNEQSPPRVSFPGALAPPPLQPFADTSVSVP